ncbi:hypothetical protein ACO0LG_09970 [Undibacterium sp. Ji42W]|uniref:hypothetical protein n=1 Tax=Undibacterium sp. Ji42W TaxID=3413039 RepID=UPI003BF335F7
MVVVALSNPDEVRDILAPLKGKKPNPGARHDVEKLMQKGTCWKMEEGGQIVGAFVAEVEGQTLWITAAAGRASFNLCDFLAGHMDKVSRGHVTEIMFRTARPGLVKQAKKHGYEIAEYWMKKKI